MLGIARDPLRPESLVFTDDHGRVLAPAATPRPPSPGTPLGAVASELGLPEPRWEHPSGERLDHWFVDFDDPPTAA